MPPRKRDASLASWIEASPLPLAFLGADGRLESVSKTFQEATGLSAGDPGPSWLESAGSGAAGPIDGQPVQVGERHFDLWSWAAGAGRLVALHDRAELVRMEDQIWEQQARLSKAYSELSVRNHALTSTLERLQQRETELSEMNRGLEEKVDEQLKQLARSDRLRRYLSPEVANAVLESEAHHLATRKRILTILFADLGTFDELVAEMESEEIIEILNEYREEVTQILFASGGTLDKFMGSRMMAFFGDPIPHADHAERAVHAGLKMQGRVQKVWRKWFPAATAADITVGIHTGYVTVGNVGSQHRVDYTVIGKNVALASAIQQEAKLGQVLLSARTYEAVKERFEFESLQVILKGSSRPITTYSARPKAAPVPETLDLQVAPTAMAPASVSPLPGLPQKLGPYVILEKLGEGGMGVVYKALDERLQRTVALKVLSSELAVDAKFASRFQREARALASLNSPFIAQIYFISDHEIPPFFAMELIEGPTLKRVIAEQGRLPLRRALDLLTQMAKGLEAAVEKGVIHRDVKPDNVMLTPKGQAKLTDFGLVKGASGDDSLTSRGFVLGTPLYMSPEQARGEELDLRSDIYSLGATFFHMLCAEPPFSGKNAMMVLRKHEMEDLPPLSSLPSSLSPRVYQILRRMMAKKREDRFETYPALLEALEEC